jgi:hypothetical protein
MLIALESNTVEPAPIAKQIQRAIRHKKLCFAVCPASRHNGALELISAKVKDNHEIVDHRKCDLR